MSDALITTTDEGIVPKAENRIIAAATSNLFPRAHAVLEESGPSERARGEENDLSEETAVVLEADGNVAARGYTGDGKREKFAAEEAVAPGVGDGPFRDVVVGKPGTLSSQDTVVQREHARRQAAFEKNDLLDEAAGEVVDSAAGTGTQV